MLNYLNHCDTPRRMQSVRVLKDGRHMHVRLATEADIPVILRQFCPGISLARCGQVGRAIGAFKSWLYITSPCAWIFSGWVEGELAGVVYCTDRPQAVRRAALSPAALRWIAKQLFGRKALDGLRVLLWGLRQCLTTLAARFRSHRRTARDERSHEPADLRQGWVTDMWTSPAFRRLGVAQTLLHEAEETLRARGARCVTLYVKRHNADAIALFSKSGYAKARLVGSGSAESWLMVKELPCVNEATQ